MKLSLFGPSKEEMQRLNPEGRITKTRLIACAVAGGYLVYLGFSIIKELLADKQTSRAEIVLFFVFSILFIVFGAFTAYRSYRIYKSGKFYDPNNPYVKQEEDPEYMKELEEKYGAENVKKYSNAKEIKEVAEKYGDEAVAEGEDPEYLARLEKQFAEEEGTDGNKQ